MGRRRHLKGGSADLIRRAALFSPSSERRLVRTGEVILRHGRRIARILRLRTRIMRARRAVLASERRAAAGSRAGMTGGGAEALQDQLLAVLGRLPGGVAAVG